MKENNKNSSFVLFCLLSFVNYLLARLHEVARHIVALRNVLVGS